MWGMRRFPDMGKRRTDTASKQLLFVGLARDGQGIEDVLDFLADNKDFTLAIVGVAANGYECTIEKAILDRGVSERVYFQNRFHSDEELREIASKSFAGLALYSLGEENFTHYADPGKVKAYIELGLPIIMTRISEVVPFVERFHAGEVVSSIEDVGPAAKKIAENYDFYENGAHKFADFFEYSRQYNEAFRIVEKIWD